MRRRRIRSSKRKSAVGWIATETGCPLVEAFWDCDSWLDYEQAYANVDLYELTGIFDVGLNQQAVVERIVGDIPCVVGGRLNQTTNRNAFAICDVFMGIYVADVDPNLGHEVQVPMGAAFSAEASWMWRKSHTFVFDETTSQLTGQFMQCTDAWGDSHVDIRVKRKIAETQSLVLALALSVSLGAGADFAAIPSLHFHTNVRTLLKMK